MTEPILLLRLEGPLQGWGFRSRWSRRDTGTEPTKSAIIGLLGCAVGIIRPDWRSVDEPDRRLEQWDKVLDFGVRIDRPGIIETDYHTVQGRHRQADGKLKRNKTEVKYSNDKWVFWSEHHTEITWRDYLHDAAFLVALAVKPEHRDNNGSLLQTLKNSLENPKWPLYLGRKSCVPSRPIFYRLANEYEDIESALRKERRPASRSVEKRRDLLGPKTLAWIECSDGEYERADAIRMNQLRFYDFRRCRRVEIDDESIS